MKIGNHLIPNSRIITILFLGAALCGLIFLVNKKEEGVSTPSVWETGIPSDSVTQQSVPVTEEVLTSENALEFRDNTLKISFLYPNDLKASVIPNESGQVILIQNPEQGKGIQITVSSFDDVDTNITEARIRADIPDMVIKDPQPVLLGEHSGQGLAFMSDNEAFSGSSREVWFVYKGKLYQLSTYARLDPLLKSILATWKFE